MRVVSPHVTDMSVLHQDLNWGKWNSYLHLKDEHDKEKLRELIRDADVVVDGYRPRAMDRLEFSHDVVFDLVRGRDRGIIHVRENCYRWHGPWSHRSGWQQASDAVSFFSFVVFLTPWLIDINSAAACLYPMVRPWVSTRP